MKRQAALLILSLSLLLAACVKKAESDGEVISKRIQELVKTEKVDRVIPSTDQIPGPGTIIYAPNYGKTYQFDPPFIQIEGTYYNLGSLKNYYISYIESDKTLFLVF